MALLHREEEPRPPQSTQRNSNDRRRAHPATEGSRGSAAPEGEPRPMLKMQRDATDGGTLTASEGSLRLYCTGRESPLFSAEYEAQFNASDGGLSQRPKGARDSAAPGVRAPPAAEYAA